MNHEFLPEAELYPLKFTPICQTRVWGGDQLHNVLHRDLPDTGNTIGESWEISDRDDVNSVVASGPLAGKSIRELVRGIR